MIDRAARELAGVSKRGRIFQLDEAGVGSVLVNMIISDVIMAPHGSRQEGTQQERKEEGSRRPRRRTGWSQCDHSRARSGSNFIFLRNVEPKIYLF